MNRYGTILLGGNIMIIAFTGAGISQQSGIQTFQDVPGIREKLTREYAQYSPKQYRETIAGMFRGMEGKKPNDAHIALAEYSIPVITMNIDHLHEKAGSEDIMKLHGRMPTKEELEYCEQLYNTPVLYGDPAPNYTKAYSRISRLGKGDILLVIGVSYSTMIASELVREAQMLGCEIIEINEDAAGRVRKVLEGLRI